MKKLILITSILASFSALSCPDLVGSYNCSQTDDMGGKETFSMSIKQNTNEFDISTDGNAAETLIADGVTRIFDTLGQQLNMTLSCDSRVLTMKMEGEVSIDDEAFDMSSDVGIVKSGRILTQRTVTKALGNTMVTTAICKEI